jgi:endogenous inhibitor of DNA gyrase (YacG/DUF329 family)
MSEKKEEFYTNGVPAGRTPTNREAAKRPYCSKHSRAMLDIGGEKKCPSCQKEATK